MKHLYTFKILSQGLYRTKWGLAITMLAIALIVASTVIVLPRSHLIYAAGSPTLTVTPTSGAYTDRDDQQPIRVQGTNYAANESVAIYWNYKGPGTGKLVAASTTNT